MTQSGVHHVQIIHFQLIPDNIDLPNALQGMISIAFCIENDDSDKHLLFCTFLSISSLLTTMTALSVSFTNRHNISLPRSLT